ncbi:uncharacterized protein LOC129588605 [Paramacrobiotus metropolitanus]|uniref:uncharacterized protein LOC129588605 n=1 Tax=Paramacrobiotus metropolitanus TaxID=2943436 RepID=UPI002445BC7B|nr:uncharacterized protein LOC129588605 [Paramacrobiotus metropolitanus]
MSSKSATATPDSDRRDDGFISDNELDGLKKKLDDDIRQMEDHMKQWRKEHFDPDGFAEKTYKESRTSTTTTTTSKTTYFMPESEAKKSPQKSILKHWRADNLNGPLKFNVEVNKQAAAGNHESRPPTVDNDTHVRFIFDLGKFHPKEIRVRVVNDKLKISAKREKQTDAKSIGEEYNREVILPADVDAESATSVYSKNGVLVVDMRYKAREEIKPFKSTRTFYTRGFSSD